MIFVFCAGNITAQSSQETRGNIDAEFPPDYELLLPGYKKATADMPRSSSESEDNALDEAGEAGVSFFSKIFSDRTVLNILLLVLGFVIFIIYRLRSGKVRR